jgi:hypothetical protein
MELKVIDETQHGAPALSVKVIGRLFDDLRTRQLRDEFASSLPGFGGRYREPKRRHLVGSIGRIT